MRPSTASARRSVAYSAGMSAGRDTGRDMRAAIRRHADPGASSSRSPGARRARCGRTAQDDEHAIDVVDQRVRQRRADCRSGVPRSRRPGCPPAPPSATTAASGRGRAARRGRRAAPGSSWRGETSERSSVEALRLRDASRRCCDSSTMPMTLELRSKVRTAISSSSPRWNSNAEPRMSSPPITGSSAAGLAVDLVGHLRAPRRAAVAQRAAQVGRMLAVRCIGQRRACGVSGGSAAADHQARLVEHQDAAAEQLRDRLAQRRQRCAARQQRGDLLVRVDRGLDVAQVPLELVARLVGLRERRVGALEVVRVLQRHGAVGGQRGQHRRCSAPCACGGSGRRRTAGRSPRRPRSAARRPARRCLPRETCRRASARARSGGRAGSRAS